MPPEVATAIDGLIGGQIEQRTTAAASIGVSGGGRLLLAHGYGHADREHGIAATGATRYRVGSLTKQFTAASILLLAEQKELAVDDLLARYVPEYTYAASITLRQLLNECSGMSPNTTHAFAGVFGATTPAEAIAQLNHYPLDFAPGTQFADAHVDYYMLGVVLERVAQMPYARFLQQRIAGPLGLVDTFLDGSRPDSAVAAAYNAVGGVLSAVKPWSVDYTFSAGGLVSTVTDLLQWNAALRNGQLLSAASWQLMTTVPSLSPPSEYAMGLIVNAKGKAVRIWHSGRAGGAHAMDAQYRDVDRDVVVLANTNGADCIAPEHLANVVVGLIEPRCAFAAKPSAAPKLPQV
ncbi:MAG: serine hydrolase domain-containing protein [Vulcanimicrobiaceae bacterium]